MKDLSYVEGDLAQKRDELAIKPVAMDEAWLQGFFSEEGSKQNPYFRFSRQYTQWKEGWWCGCRGLDPFVFYYDNRYKRFYNKSEQAQRLQTWKKRLLQFSGLALFIGTVMGSLYGLMD